MAMIHESRKAALKPEEASLLPALPRHMGGQAALGSVLRAARALEDKQVSNAVEARENASAGVQERAASAGITPPSRAALHHILRR